MLRVLFRPRGFVLGLLLMVLYSVSGAVFAFGSVPAGTTRIYTSSTTGGTVSSPAAACASAESIKRALYPSVTPSDGGNPYQIYSLPGGDCACSENAGAWTCSGGFKYGQSFNSAGTVGFGDAGSYSEGVATCPGGSIASGSDCLCPAGKMPQGLGCVTYNCSDTTTSDDVWIIPNGGVSTACGGENAGAAAGCVIRFDMKNQGANGVWYGNGGTTTGDLCEPGAPGGPPTAGPTPKTCPTGQCPGTVNGQSICAPCANSNSPGPTVDAGPPLVPGGAPPTLGDPAAPPGSTRSETNTSCTAAGACTTTTNYFGPNGVPTGTVSKSDSKGGFCAENPGSPICAKSTFSGGCSTTCTGDAIQCAIAAEQHKRNCEFFAENPFSTKGIAGAQGQARPDGHPGNDAAETDISFSGQIDTSDGLGGSCPGDQSFSYAGTSVTIPFSKLCGPLGWVGNAAQAFAMLAALFIVFKQ